MKIFKTCNWATMLLKNHTSASDITHLLEYRGSNGDKRLVIKAIGKL